ncbi:hypothetical protein B0H63DRAFT_312022 [Podospora didyma]|uniref:COP9 signalosome complex subunit 3 n=1 Tax=Podospora didyma TaxID=330526 RepID=A0AAE0N4S3_9PEZI|nr:hypothetical protein B0H63DRAFT_312022 [Podospora didyma]
MDHIVSVLLSFPPGNELSNAQYDKAAQAHIKKIDKLVEENVPAFAAAAPQCLELVSPEINSLSYLALLRIVLADEKTTEAQRVGVLPKLVTFLFTFDPRQIRYAGNILSAILRAIANRELLPDSVAVDSLATAILRINPAGSMLTSHHISLVQLAYESNCIDASIPVLEKTVVFYPGMKGAGEKPFPSDMTLTPPAYITVDSGLTTKLSTTDVLQYDLLCGLCFMAKRMWQQAFDALERVITYPTKDTACSKIMVEAHNKWILVGLLLYGKTPSLPAITSPGPQKMFATLGKPYASIGKAFESLTPDTLKAEYDTFLGQNFFAEEANRALIDLVMMHYQRWQIINLRDVYTKISLEEIRARTQSAETCAQLKTEKEIETLVQAMIDEGMLNGVIEKSEDGSKPAYLTFLSLTEELSEYEFGEKMLATAQRIKELAPIVKATSERLATSREYIRHLVKEQKREKDGGSRDIAVAFESSIEDEDLMTGIMAGH